MRTSSKNSFSLDMDDTKISRRRTTSAMTSQSEYIARSDQEEKEQLEIAMCLSLEENQASGNSNTIDVNSIAIFLYFFIRIIALTHFLR